MQNFEARASLIIVTFLAFMLAMVFPPALFVAVPAAVLLYRNVRGRVREIRAAETARFDKVAAREHAAALRVFQ